MDGRSSLRIDGLLLDIGGVLYQGDEALPGAVTAIRRLKERKIPFRLLTNTTRTTSQQKEAALMSPPLLPDGSMSCRIRPGLP